MDLTVAIAVRNAESTIVKQLEALRMEKWRGDWEVVVVDDGSTDGTCSILRSWEQAWPRLRVVSAGPPGGLGHSRNVAAEAAKGRAIAYCDGDDVIGEGWVAAMGEALRTHAYVTGPMDLDCLNEPWVIPTRGASFVAATPPTFAGLWHFAHGANMGVQMAFLEQAGPFPVEGGVSEDLYLGMRAHALGAEPYFAPGAVVHYRLRSSLRTITRQSYGYGVGYALTCARLRSAGMATPANFAGLRRIAWLARRIMLITSRTGRARWVYTAAAVAGRIHGSVRYRVLAI